MPEFYMIIAQKIFSRFFLLGEGTCLSGPHLLRLWKYCRYLCRFMCKTHMLHKIVIGYLYPNSIPNPSHNSDNIIYTNNMPNPNHSDHTLEATDLLPQILKYGRYLFSVFPLFVFFFRN